MAGKRSVNGTLVKAPMKATRSLKNGMAFATKKADADVTNVMTIHRRCSDQVFILARDAFEV